jgi:hypothetical protein
MLIFNRRQLQRAVSTYVDHYNAHRFLSQAAPLRALPDPADADNVRVLRRDRLGGLIHEYQQAA